MTNEELISQIKSGDDVRGNLEKLYNQNLPLIRMYLRPYEFYNCMPDMEQEAYLSMLQAVDTYRPEKGRFSTWLPFYVQQAAQRCIRKGRYTKETAVLNSPLSGENGEDMTLEDTLQADSDPENDVCEDLYQNHLKSEIWGVLGRYLPEREIEILKKLFLDKKTLVEIAEDQGVTDRRIFQIKEKAFERIRMNAAAELMDKLEEVSVFAYRGGMRSFSRYFTSATEAAAIKRVTAEDVYRQKIAESDRQLTERLEAESIRIASGQ